MNVHALVSRADLLIALAIGTALNVVIIGAIALSKVLRERAERLRARVRDGLTEQLLPLLEGQPQPVALPAPHTAAGEAALDTVLSLIATLKGEAREQLVATLERANYIGHLITRSRTRDTRLRARYAALLGGTRSVRAVPRLTALLIHDPAPEVRIIAAEALGAIGHAPSIHVLLEAARNPTRFQELRIANVLSEMGAVVLPALQGVLEEDDTRLVSLALDILIDIGTMTRAEPVLALLQHRSPEVRARAASLLGIAGIVDAIPALVFATRDPIWFVRLRIVKALGAIGVPHDDEHREGYFAALHHLLYDEHWHVRRHAAAALAAAAPEGCAILTAVASDVARAALRFQELHKGRYVPTVL